MIADDLSDHKSQSVKNILEAHRRVRLHFMPARSSWFNTVKLSLGKIKRHIIVRGVFAAVPDLKRKLTRNIRHDNQSPSTVKST